MRGTRLMLALLSASLLAACNTGDFPDYPGGKRMAVALPPPPEASPAPLAAPPPPVVLEPPRTLAGVEPLSEESARAYMDRQEAELRRALRDAGIRVSREGNFLVLGIDEDILFAHDSAVPGPRARFTLRNLAAVLRDYAATYVDVDGFTDTTGSRDYNFKLSEDRAVNVADLLMSEGIAPARLSARGRGEEKLRVPTRDGVNEPLNRRVEITLEPYLG